MKTKHLQIGKARCWMLLLLMLPLMAGRAYAYDFSAVCSTGQTLYYTITDATNRYVSICFPGSDYYKPWTNFSKPSGTITLPSSVIYGGKNYTVTGIGNRAFYQCSGLTGNLTLPNTILTIGEFAFQDCSGFQGSLTLSSATTSIGDGAFSGCTGLSGTITIPQMVTSIGVSAFYNCAFNTVNFNATQCNTMGNSDTRAFTNCASLRKVIFGDNVQSIPSYAFKSCSTLTSIHFGSSLNSIGYMAFYYCSNVSYIYIDAVNPPVADNYSVFTNIPTTIPVYVPCGSESSYQQAIGWSDFSHIFGQPSHILTAVSQDTYKGTAEIIQVPSCGNNVSAIVSATANVGYGFSNWTENGSVVSSENPYSFTLSGDRNLVANFAVVTAYTISVGVNPSGAGTVTGGGRFNQGTEITVRATPNTNYVFLYWREGNTIVSNNAEYTFTVNSQRSLTAYFSKIYYDFSAVCETGQTLYYKITDATNHKVELTCPSTPDFSNGWRGFEKPTGEIILPSIVTYNNTTYTVSSIGNYAFTSCNGLTGTLTLPDAISSIGNSAFYDCSGFSGSLILPNTLNSIESQAFIYCSGFTGTLTIPNSVTAINSLAFRNCTGITSVVFNATNCSIMGSTSSPVFNGCTNLTSLVIGDNVTKIPDNAFYGCNKITSNIIIPNSVISIGNYAFTNCSNMTSIELSSSTPATAYSNSFSGVPTNIPVHIPCGSLSAYQSATGWSSFTNYQEDFNYTLTISSSNTNMGTVAVTQQPSCGVNAIVKATPKANYRFVNWTKGNNVVSTDAVYTFAVTEDIELVANFAISNYTISASANPAIGGTVTGADTYNHGANVTLTATANEGYTFVNWTENNVEVSTSPTYSFTASADRTLIANFSLNSYTISASANPIDGGTVSGSDTYNHGANVTLSASANEGYTFINWTENDVEVSTDAEYSFTVEANRNLVANFAIQTFEITASANNSDYGTVTGGGTFDYGTMASLTATPNTGYTFINWTENDVEVSTDAEYSFTVEANRNLVANFAIQAFEITASANNSDYGTVTGGGTFDYGTMASLTATPNTGYTFINWTENDVEVSTDAEYSFTVEANRNLVANFAIQAFEITASANNSDYGTVTGGGTFDYGTMASLTATPNTGYTFINWTENDVEVSTDAEYSFTVEANRNLVANFAAAGTGNHWNPDISLYADNMSVVAEIHIDGAVQTSTDIEIGAFCGDEVRGSRRVEYKGTPFDKYVAFLTVYGESNDNITFKVYNHQNNEELNCRVAQSLTFTPNGTVGDLISPYVIEFFTTANITATANPAAGGTVSGDGVYSVGETVTLTATADEYYRFVNWTEDDVEVSTSETYSFTAFDNRNLVANFEIKNHWIPDESLYADNMSVVGEIRIDGMTQTSGDIEIGAFCGEEVRGSQRIVYTPTPIDKYIVFLTVYGEPNDNITFKLYNHQIGSEYDLTAPEPITFAPNATVGGLDTPHILNFCHIQTRELTAGWNWYSTYIDIEGEDGFNMLTAGLGEDGLQVKSQSQFALYYPEYDIWTGSLNEADNHKLYMIQMSSPHTLVMTGAFTDVESTPITINKGWTWIGYPVTQNMSLDEATSNINPSNGDYFKSQSGFSIYYEGYGWAGSLNTLEPGHGYMYQNNGESSMTLVYPTPGARGTLEENVTADGNHWIPNAYQFADNMSVVAVINIDGVEQLSENLEVGAFSDGECRGSARPIYVEAVDRYMLFMTVYGEGGENLDFRLFDADDNEEYQLQTSMVFEPNGTVGNLVNPYVFDLSVMGIGEEQQFAFRFYPNPICSGKQLAIEGEYDKIEIINSIGVVIGEYTNTNEIEITMISGVYYIRAINDKSIIINKLVVK